MGIFALGVMPYISASIIMTLMQSSIPHLKTLREQGSKGRRKIIQYSRYLTVIIAALQGYGVAIGLESMQFTSNFNKQAFNFKVSVLFLIILLYFVSLFHYLDSL